MSFQYNFSDLKEAILFNTAEVLPGDEKQLDKEIQNLVDEANKTGEQIRHYIGFEISGQIHFPGSVYQMLNVAKLQKAGVHCILWMADYHTWINKKLDGKIKTIRKVAEEYFEPILRKSLEVAGGDSDKLKVLYAKDEYFRKNENDLSFWDYEFEVERNITLSRILRSLSVAGKEAGESTDYQLTRYPGMQAADIFWHQTHIVQGGLDQRKIYVLARDNAFTLDSDFRLKIGEREIKPIVLFNQLLLGLEAPKAPNLNSELTQIEISKMSKSKPDSAIWVHDSYEEILRKLKKAYCPMPKINLKDGWQNDKELLKSSEFLDLKSEQDLNPLLDWCKKMIFPAGKVLEVQRPEKFGGNKEYFDYKTLENDYFIGNLHPLDLKTAVAKCLADWFEPIKKYVETNPQGLELVKNIKKL